MPGLYIQMYTIHGLVRAKDLELGVDEDTGGQIVYILELAKALSKLPQVDKIEIVTRKIKDKRYPGYDKDKERVCKKTHIVRIDCGPKKYVKKVDLWPYLDEFVENVEKYIKRKRRKPNIVESNYVDGGFVGRRIAKKFNLALVHVSHSLAKPEIKRLPGLKKHFSRQVSEEQEIINDADVIIASSKHEKFVQYSLYDINKLRKIHVIHPGIDFKRFKPFKQVKTGEKPIVLAMTRIDIKKNLIGAVKAFSKDKKLQKMAKLFVASSTFGAKNLDKREKELIDELKKEIKKSRLEDVVLLINPDDNGGPENLYHIVAQSGGVFVNSALFEGFGLTTLEAGISGLPVVVTKNGGPLEVVEKCRNGILIDPKKTRELSRAIKKILKNKKLWKKYHKNGIKNVKKYYSWQNAVKKQIKLFKKLI